MTPDLIAGRYRALRPIGQGGMGTVWLCRDEVLGREVAVKQAGLLPGESATDTARALREARSSAALSHHNVVSMFDIVDSGDGRAWLVMEYVPSRTLAEILREEGPLDPRRAAAIGAQVAEGLAAAHAAGTVHRDVKPGNVLVRDDDVAKISDFGIARRDSDDQLTRTGLVTGTPAYFSPELARGEDPGPAADVYALGATLYAVVEGHTPYPDQGNPIAVLRRIADEEPPPAERLGPLAVPVARMMDRDPRSRWTMADAAHGLRRLAESRGTAAAATAGDPDPSREESSGGSGGSGGSGSRGHRRAAGWLVGAAILLVAMLGTGAVLIADIGDGSGGTEGRERAGAAATPSRSPEPSSAKPSPSPSPEPSRSPHEAGTPSPTRTPSSPSRTTAPQKPGRAMEQAVGEYFSLMPENTDAGWQRLAPSMQAQGRDSYEGWWDDVDSVQLHSADAVAGQQQVDIDLTYHFDDGSGSRETQRLTLQRDGGRYLIADDEVLSSRSVS